METIKLDLIPGKKMPSLHASQFDDGREHGIDLFENGVVYKLDGTETLTINERKGDDCICSLDIVNTFAETNHIVFASTEQMCAVWGNNICELVIAKGEKTIGTLNFILEIEPSPTENGIESESEIKNLERQIEAITEEVIGDNYYTAEETDEAIATAIEGKADKTYVDEELDKKANTSDVYNKTQTYNKQEVDDKIAELPAPVIFKGTLGVGGTIQTLPTASASNEGWMFKCITAGTYEGLTLKVGDTVTCFNPPNTSNYYWDKTGSQDTDTDTWRNIKVNGVEKLGNGISSGAVDFVGSENIEVEFDNNGNKVGVKTKNIYTKTEVDDIVYNILPDDTASGSVANFETDLALPIKSLEIDVNAKQDLHGYDYPWPAGGGKNLLPFENVLTEGWSRTNSGITAEYSNGVMHVYGTNELNAWNNIVTFNDAWRYSEIRLPAQTYSIPDHLIVRISEDNVNYSNKGGTVIYNNPIYVRGFYISVPANYTVDWYVPLMFVYGSVIPTSYEPYENICPISGWNEISVVQTGTNIWNGITEVGSFDTTTGEKVANNNLLRSVNPIPVKPNATYMRLIDASLGFRVFYYDKNMNFLSMEVSQYTQLAITIPNDCYYMNIAYQKAVASVSINYPPTDTSFRAYNPNGTTEAINLGGTCYGGRFTQDKLGHRQFDDTISALVNLSDLTFNPTTKGGHTCFYADLPNGVIKSGGEQAFFGKCSTYTVTSNLSLPNDLSCVFYCSELYGGYTRILIRDDSASAMTGAQFTAYVTGQITYEKANPQTIALPDGEPITTLIGTNNIFADTGDTSVVFKDSVNGYVEKKIAGVQALALNT